MLHLLQKKQQQKQTFANFTHCLHVHTHVHCNPDMANHKLKWNIFYKANKDKQKKLLCLVSLQMRFSPPCLLLITWLPFRYALWIVRGNHCHCGCRIQRLLHDVRNEVAVGFGKGGFDWCALCYLPSHRASAPPTKTHTGFVYAVCDTMCLNITEHMNEWSVLTYCPVDHWRRQPVLTPDSSDTAFWWVPVSIGNRCPEAHFTNSPVEWGGSSQSMAVSGNRQYK